MIPADSRPASRAYLLPLALLVAAAAFRWAKLKGYVTLEVLENFGPWMALAFTGTLVFSKRVSFLLIPLLLVAVDAAASGLHSVLHWEALAVYPCFAVAALLASRQRGKMGLIGSLVGVVACALVFYLITNTVAWISAPVYSKDLAGWVQALTTGDPAAVFPSWWFLRNSLMSDLAFSLLLLAAYNTEAAFRQQQRIPLLQPLAA